jgi:carboxymethylenebutenolidase
MSKLAVQSRWERLPGEAGGIDAFVAEPAEGGPFSGLLCFHTLAGVNANLRETAERIASHGCVVVAPNLYHRATADKEFRMPMDREKAEAAAATVDFYSVAADSRVMLNFLKLHPKVRSDRLGVLGYCVGGTWSFLAACFNQDVRACVVAYGTGIVTGARSAGRPIDPIELGHRIRGSVLWLSGAADPFIPASDVNAMTQRLKAEGKTVEQHIYTGEPAAGHAFFSSDQPRFYNAAAAEWGWNVKLDFLERELF